MSSLLPRCFFSLGIVAVAALSSAPALASLSFPPVIQSELGLVKAPDCTLCHRTDAGGFGTVTRPFGRTMMSQLGLTAANTAALRSALSGADAAKFDSDDDGVSDIDELRMGTDPNVGTSGVEAAPEVPLPQTGCALRANPSESPWSATAALVVVVAGLALQSRRSGRATRTSRIRNRLRIRA